MAVRTLAPLTNFPRAPPRQQVLYCYHNNNLNSNFLFVKGNTGF